MPGDAPPKAPANSAEAPLQRIANVLGVPVDHVFAGARAGPHRAGATALLRLWAALRDQDDREALLAGARDLVSRYDVAGAAAGWSFG